MEQIRILTPANGAMMGDIAGTLRGDSLFIDVAVQTSAGHVLTVNGEPMTDHAGIYTAVVALNAWRNPFTIRDETEGTQTVAVWFRLKNDSMRYRLSLDDNIWFFQNITKQGYASLFDDPYLRLMRSMHEKYGTKVHINCYYCCPESGGFNLTQFPDRYRGEWETASGWLRLSFHALMNLPDRPYIGAGYEQASGECEMVNREILRFAGPQSLSDYTTIHWCEGTADACRAFRANGYRTLQAGKAGRDDPIRYYLDDDAYGAVVKYGYWRDEARDLSISRASVCLNAHTPEVICEKLDEEKRLHPLSGFIDMVMHEEYFYSSYVQYLPDFAQRVEAGVRWCAEHGYTPSFRSETVRPWQSPERPEI